MNPENTLKESGFQMYRHNRMNHHTYAALLRPVFYPCLIISVTAVCEVIRSFTAEKQGYSPEIILVSPPETSSKGDGSLL